MRSRPWSDSDRRGCCCCDGRDCCTTASGRTVHPSLGHSVAVRRRILRRSRREHCHPAHRRARPSGARAPGECSSRAVASRCRRGMPRNARHSSRRSSEPSPTRMFLRPRPSRRARRSFSSRTTWCSKLYCRTLVSQMFTSTRSRSGCRSARRRSWSRASSRGQCARVRCCERQTRGCSHPRVAGGAAGAVATRGVVCDPGVGQDRKRTQAVMSGSTSASRKEAALRLAVGRVSRCRVTACPSRAATSDARG